MSSLRALASRLIPAPDGKEALYKVNGNTGDIATKVLLCFNENNYQVASLAPYIRAASLMDTCRTIWNLVKNNIAYVMDPPGEQWVRTPARLWSDAQGDCKSYSVFIASCLHQLGIKCSFRFVSFNYLKDKDGNYIFSNGKKIIGPPTHVYIVVKNKGREIILDAVLPAFDQEKPFIKKWDYNTMTRISQLSGINKQPQQIAGGLSTLINKKARRETLNQAFPGLALLGLYIFIPGYGNTMPNYTHNSVGTPDNLFDRVPQVVKDKARKASDSFWDFGDWADIKVENEVFPKLKQLLTAQLGIDPHEWWRRQLRSAGIGSAIGFDPITVITAGTKAAGIFSQVKGTVGNLFGGSDIQWKRGDPSTWGPAQSDWASLGINPLANVPVQGTTAAGNPLPVTYIPPALPTGQTLPTTPLPNNTLPLPLGSNNNTMFYAGGAALLAYLFLKK